MPEYLTTKELAELLRIKERKVYDLAAAGEVPCAKVTGKLLFPERDVRAWLAEGRVGPQIGAAIPNVFLGSHDPLLGWAMRESRCGLATYFDGSLDGLERFVNGEGVAAGMHVYEPADQTWNIAEVSRCCADRDAVLVGFAARHRGLIVAEDSAIAALDDLKGRTLVPRQAESGAERLFSTLLSQEGIAVDAMSRTMPARSEADAALAVAKGHAEAAFGLEALAAQNRLGFVPIIEERFDLLIDRRAYFETPIQALLAFCRSDAFRRNAADLRGYDTRDLGVVRWNGA